MFMETTIATRESISFGDMSCFTYTENMDFVYLKEINSILSTLKSEQLVQQFESVITLYQKVLGNYDEKIMIDGQIQTLRELIHLTTQYQHSMEPSLRKLNMLYLSIYRLDQQIQTKRYLPLFKEIISKNFGELTLCDLSEWLVMTDNQTGIHVVKEIQHDFTTIPKSLIEEFVKNAFYENMRSVTEIKQQVYEKIKRVEMLLGELPNIQDTTEMLRLLNKLPLSRFNKESIDIQTVVVEKLMETNRTVFSKFAHLQRFIVLETIRTKNKLWEKQQKVREKTVEQKLIEQAMTYSNEKAISTLTL